MQKIEKFFSYGNENPKYLAIMLHGYGSNGEDLISLAPQLAKIAPDTHFIAPNAPMQINNAFIAGYQWFDLDNRNPQIMYPQIIKANDFLDLFIAEKLLEFDLQHENLIYIGFSQGAMMALYNGLRSQKTAAGIIAFSGRFISPQDLGEEINSKPEICLIHGDKDEVVPIENFDKAKEDLETLKCQLEAHKINNLEHSINFSAFNKAENFLEKITS